MRFECRRCGTCCIEKIVAVNPADLRRIWKHLGGSPFDYVIFRNDAHINNRRVVGDKHTGVLTLKKKENGECIFLEDDNHCSIHDIRPMSCRMYPFDPSFVSEMKGVRLDKINIDESCPGFGKGDEYDITDSAMQWLEERQELDEIAIGWPGNLMQFVARCVHAKLAD